MRVLITNDDGVEAPGLRALAHAVADAGHEAFVVAPDGEHSGAGAAIGRLHRSGPIGRTRVEWPDLPSVAVDAIAAPPAVTVYAAAAGAFGPPPELVCSGVNRGLNTGHLVIHSGTVGAALSAVALGFPAMAVSLAWGEHEHWDTAAALAAAAVPAAARLTGQALNVSVPNLALEDIAGVRPARLAGFAERWVADVSADELRLTYEGHEREPASDTDLWLAKAGYVAVTVLGRVTGTPAVDAAETIAASTAAHLAR